MKNIIITRATGMVGGLILKECLRNPEINKVTSIVRHSSGVSNKKLIEIIPEKFTSYGDLKAHFENQDVAYFCLGVYTGQVPDSIFKEITLDYTVAFADALKSGSPEVSFCFLSGAGADRKEKSRLSFARYKGMAENYLIRKEFKKLHIFRPAYIYPVEKRAEPNFSYRITRKLYPLIKLFGNNMSIKSTELATAMFKLGFGTHDKTILENKDILQIQ